MGTWSSPNCVKIILMWSSQSFRCENLKSNKKFTKFCLFYFSILDSLSTFLTHRSSPSTHGHLDVHGLVMRPNRPENQTRTLIVVLRRYFRTNRSAESKLKEHFFVNICLLFIILLISEAGHWWKVRQATLLKKLEFWDNKKCVKSSAM